MARYAAAIAVTVVFLFPVYWLFMISFKTPEEIFHSPPVWYPARIQFDNYRRALQGRRCGNGLATAWSSPACSTLDRHVPRHPGRLQPCALQDRRRESLRSGSSRSAWCRRSRSCSRSSCSTSGSAGSTPIIGLILLYTAFNLPYVIWMMRGYIVDIPIELEESGAGRRLHPLAGVAGRVVFPMVAHRPVRDRGLHLHVRLERFHLRAGAHAHARSPPTRCRLRTTSAAQSNFWAKIAAMSVLGTLPIFIAVAALQRYLVRGISLGAVKG